MSNLYDLGYDAGQINQITKLQSIGIDVLPYTDYTVGVEKLRNLYAMLNGSSYVKKDVKMILKYFFKKDIDVSRYVADGYHLSCQLDIIVEMLEKGYPVSIFTGKHYEFTQMKEIYKYLKKGTDVSKFIDAGISAETGFLLESNGLNYEVISGKFDETRIKSICAWLKEGVNVANYIKPNYTSSQIGAVASAIKADVDVEIVTKGDLSGSIMAVIRDGLLKGVDITSYLKPEHNMHFAKTILSYMEKGIDANKALKYEDYKYANLAVRVLEKGLDDDFIKESIAYDTMKFLIKAKIASSLNPDVDFDLIFTHADYPIHQLSRALNIMEKGFDASALLERHILANSTLCEIEKAIYDGIVLNGYIAGTESNIEINSIIVLLRAGYEIKPRKE